MLPWGGIGCDRRVRYGEGWRFLGLALEIGLVEHELGMELGLGKSGFVRGNPWTRFWPPRAKRMREFCQCSSSSRLMTD